MGVLFKPSLGVAEARAKASQLTPKPAGVVHLLEVDKFMQDEVVTYEDGGLHETPVERDGTPSGTGAPTGTLVADGDAANRQLMQGGQLEDARRQFPSRQPPQMPLDGRAEIASRI